MPIVIPWRLVGAMALVMLGAISAWTVQGWRYGAQLAEQSRLHTDTLNQLAMLGAAAQKAVQDKHLALEQRLSASDQSHYKELSDAQKDQSRLRDRLATSDLRLSVLLAEGSANSGTVSSTAGASGVVHGPVRAELDPAHAQRIVAITDEGDRGLIALGACQTYLRGVQANK